MEVGTGPGALRTAPGPGTPDAPNVGGGWKGRKRGSLPVAWVLLVVFEVLIRQEPMLVGDRVDAAPPAITAISSIWGRMGVSEGVRPEGPGSAWPRPRRARRIG
jgi:hypothetical protein